MTDSPDVLTPATVDDLIAAVRDAHRTSTPLRILGAETWRRDGFPVAGRPVRLSALAGIETYVPGDLTLTARAGTTFAEIEEATRAHGQWLPLDPFGEPAGTLGATLATASSGPLGGSIGLPRDVTVGLSLVTGDGALVHGGGRVVKNVAGFDLVRMAIGAWGTLGIVVGATVRLRARPAADETVALTLPDERDALAALLGAFRTAAVEPLAAELLSATCAQSIGLGREAMLLVRVAGNAVGVHHQRSALARLGVPAATVGADAWTGLRRSDPPGALVVRVSRRPTELARLWSAAAAMPGIDAHASLLRGIVRLRITGGATGDPLAGFDDADRRVFESVPDEWRTVVSPPAVAGDAISLRLRAAFDPRALLNPGVLGAAA